jgi:uncharacterized protein DUF4230
MLKKILIGFVLLLIFASGVLVTRWFYRQTPSVEQESATVLLERIKAVAKLVTLEGYFSEIYDYQDYYGYDLSMLRKKALIKVKAKVSVGFDLEKMSITTEPGTKTIVVTSIPGPEILSIEHDLEYYDLQEGLFNSFSKEDYNKLNANAKEFIRRQALGSDLFSRAQEQRDEIFEMMRFMAESAGWTFDVEKEKLPEVPGFSDN